MRGVLSLIVAGLLAGPHVLQWWLRRSPRTTRRAVRWWTSGPTPAEVAFLCGGPDRVADLTIADLFAERRLTVDDDGRLALTGTTVGPQDTGFRATILHRLAQGPTDLAALRFAARSDTATIALWRMAARYGLLLPAWHRQYPQRVVAASILVITYAIALTLPGLTLWIGALAVALGILAIARTRVLVAYGFDPRTAAGLRATTLALEAAAAGEPRYRIAARGLRSVSDLRPDAADPHPVPPSTWHVPWHAPRIPEPGTPWWRQAAQSPR
ncbi:TIGR04222 domain-containing membrane protein [Actinoplanes sp. NPDC051851]|uniref:TIGR04222 domain-containing membrane protein n=1 Tax=Actinoplanes sp. NPDC051851 TaxID=3154753 RepID=UPI00342615DB